MTMKAIRIIKQLIWFELLQAQPCLMTVTLIFAIASLTCTYQLDAEKIANKTLVSHCHLYYQLLNKEHNMGKEKSRLCGCSSSVAVL